MRFTRARLATQPLAQPRTFGRGPVRVLAAAAPLSAPAVGDEIKLFASTFAAGFLFVSVFLA